MSPEEHQWRIELVRDRYDQYQLTFIQAEKIYQYEEEMNQYSPRYFYSPWEEWDHQYLRFKDILNEYQFNVFESNWHERLQSYEAALIKEDESIVRQIHFTNALLTYYRHVFIPAILADPEISVFPFRSNIFKVQFLANEYRSSMKELNGMRKVEHFRLSRRFQPNKLKLLQLQYEIDTIIPNIDNFSALMDTPTQAIADHIAGSTHFLSEEVQRLEKIHANLSAFFHETQQKYLLPIEEGFQVTLQKDDLSEKKNRILETALLSEINKNHK